MCDPLTIAGAVLTAGSVAANSIAQQRVQSARDDAIEAHNIRQGRLDDEAAALNAQSRGRYEGFEGQQDERAQSLGDFLSAQTVREPDLGMSLPQSQSSITVQEETKQRDRARERTDESAEGLARLRSFGDLLGGISREQARDAGLVGQIGGFQRGNSSVLPLDLAAANSKGGGLRLLGDVLGGVGSVGVSAGLGGAEFSDLNPFGGGGSSVPIPRPRPTRTVRLPSLY